MVDMREFWNNRGTSVVITVAIVATIFFVCLGLTDLKSDIAPQKSEIVRNYGLLIAACWGAALAVWRSQIASEQVEASERSLSDGRLQKGADMLDDEDYVTRMGGIYTLGHLAKHHPDGYYREQIVKLLAAFVRSPVSDVKIEKRIQEIKSKPSAIGRKFPDVIGRKFREDVWEAVCIVIDLNKNKVLIARPDFSHAKLNNMLFRDMDFSGISFESAELKEANLFGCNLTSAYLLGCDLSDAKIIECDLTSAIITDSDCTGSNFSFTDFTNAILASNVSGANFREVIGLSQKQLDQACQKPGTPPPQNIPSALKWDEDAAMERWIERYGENPDRPIPD